MSGTIWHCHIAISLDGKIARRDGSFDWLEGYPAEEFGIESFLAGVDAILMGRNTYDTVLGLGAWPHAGKPTVVMTSRPLVDPPAGVEARSGDLGAVTRSLEQRGCRRVWVEGGSELLRAMIAAGKLDILEMAVIPILLGEGIPLIPDGTPELKLRLKKCEARSTGALHVIYEAERPASGLR